MSFIDEPRQKQWSIFSPSTWGTDSNRDDEIDPVLIRKDLRDDLADLSYEIRTGVSSHRAIKRDVARIAFERAKASASYDVFATIKYRLILPLKEMMTIELTDAEVSNLDLYRKHTALCSGIEKVQNAYKSYIAAQEVADQSPTNSADARLHAMVEGNSLVNNYTSLIKLAIAQAEEIGMEKNEYVEDLHNVMGDKELRIFDTVNSIRLKAVEAEWFNGSKSDAKEAYLKFVTEFVSNVREARLQIGNTSVFDDDDLVYISDAYIHGLAAIPELGDGLVLIELYDELSKQQARVAESQNEVITYFRDKIAALMNQEQDITTEDLQQIQFKGIPLLTVLKSISAETLNNLKKLGSSLSISVCKACNFFCFASNSELSLSMTSLSRTTSFFAAVSSA